MHHGLRCGINLPHVRVESGFLTSMLKVLSLSQGVHTLRGLSQLPRPWLEGGRREFGCKLRYSLHFKVPCLNEAVAGQALADRRLY